MDPREIQPTLCYRLDNGQVIRITSVNSAQVSYDVFDKRQQVWIQSYNPVPVSMTAKEIEAVQSSGRLSDAILSRLPASDVPAGAPKKAAGRPVAGPTKRPPRARPSK